MKEKVLILDGDGIGPTVMSCAEKVMDAFDDTFEIIHGGIGASSFESTGHYLPHEVLDSIEEVNTILCGPVSFSGTGLDPITNLKILLDVTVKHRFFRTFSGDIGAESMEVDLWSDNNNVYNDTSEMPDLEGVRMSTYAKSSSYEKMMDYVSMYAAQVNMDRIACIAPDYEYPKYSGMFRSALDSRFPSDKYSIRHVEVDDWASHVVKNPRRDRFVVTVDIFSKVISGVLSGLAGYDHLFPITYIGDKYNLHIPCKEAVLPDVEEGYCNPTSAILSVHSILRDRGMIDEAQSVIDAISMAYRNNERTPDVGGSLSAEEFTNRIVSYIGH